MLFHKKKSIPTFTFYDPKDDVSFITEKQQSRLSYATKAKDELNQLIGLEKVKKWINAQEAILKINKERQSTGIQTKNNQTMHMVFLGNPGTGKTECARLIGKIYYGLGILPTDSFVEVSRRDLVCDGYKKSSDKVAEVFKNALGGILFIDEAYSICYGPQDPDGIEAVDTLLKLMEDYRDNIAVIMAGYTNEIQKFLQTNPGFESRIPPNNRIEFEDYSQDELIEIFKVIVYKNGYLLAPDVTDEVICHAIINMPKTNGNARDVRNFVDTIKFHLDILLAQKENKTKDDLITITKQVIEVAL